MTMKWTPEKVGDWIKEAVETEQLLPGVRPSGYRAYWPPVVRKSEFEVDIDEYRGKYDDMKIKLYAENDAIDRFDQVQSWKKWLSPDDAKILWSWALGRPDRWVARKLSKPNGAKWYHKKVKRHRIAALKRLARKLNNREKPQHIAVAGQEPNTC